MPVEVQVASIFAGTQGFLDTVDTKDVVRYEQAMLSFLRNEKADVLKSIRDTKALDDDWLSVQPDGNAVLYRSNGAAVWSTGTSSGSGSVRMVMQNDGNLVVYRGSRATWSSGRP